MEKEAIAQVELFSSLPDDELDHLAGTLQGVQVERGRVLLNEGESEPRYFILLEGEVEVIKALGTPDERLLAVREQGSFLGEMSLFSEDGRPTASVRAKSPLQLLEMSQEDLDGLLQRHPMFSYEMMRTLSRRLAESENITIRDLRRKNRALTQAYEELKAAQAQIIEKEKLERELEVARQIQMGILPGRLPTCPEFDFGARVIPMATVGGDFYDVIQISEDLWGIAVGDVTGHGVPAALLMAMTVTLLRSEARRTEDPGEILRRINDLLMEMDHTGMFVTVLYGILSCAGREFRYARAGHEIPIMIGGGMKGIQPQHALGQPLGLLQDLALDEGTIVLPRGGLFFLYSDGVTETIDDGGERFGVENLTAALQAGMRHSAQGICQQVWNALERFRGEEIQHDDVTLMTVKVK